MIFIAASNEPTMVLMLTEADMNDMRGGRTKFVDKTATKGRKFDKVILSLHKNQHEIEEAIRASGHGKMLEGMPSPVAKPGEQKCEGCDGINLTTNLFRGKCIICWAESAESYKKLWLAQ